MYIDYKMQHLMHRCVFSKVSDYTDGDKYINITEKKLLNAHHYSLICCIKLQNTNKKQFIQNVQALMQLVTHNTNSNNNILLRYIPQHLSKNAPINIVDLIIKTHRIEYGLQLMTMGLRCTPYLIDQYINPYISKNKIKILVTLGIKCTHKTILSLINECSRENHDYLLKFIVWLHNNQHNNIIYTTELLIKACNKGCLDIAMFLLKNNTPITSDIYKVCINNIILKKIPIEPNATFSKIFHNILKHDTYLTNEIVNIIIECKIDNVFNIFIKCINYTDKRTLLTIYDAIIKNGYIYGINFMHNLKENNDISVEPEFVNNLIENSIESCQLDMFKYLISNLNHSYDITGNLKSAIDENNMTKVHIISGYLVDPMPKLLKAGVKRKR
jgi:hypothetical protein